ncbi:Zinc/iron permease [Blakeslea trispora]|nr:Zinc/iron permease [Blakeslea trispora]
MANSLKLLLASIIFSFANQVLAQDPPASESTTEEDACAALPIEDYSLGLRVGSIFIILGTSAVGTYLPILLHRIKSYKSGDIRDWILTVGKFFGTGVILATAFVHMLPESIEKFESPCLTDGWLSYGSFAGVFCMLASFALQLLEIISVAHFNKLQKLEQQCIDAELANNDKSLKSNGQANANFVEEHEHRIGDSHGHAHGVFFETDGAYKHISTYILELGIVMHSVLIGISLATTEHDEFISLLIALVFHQFFEGMALGTRLNEMDYTRWYKPILMGLIYIITTPIGIAIGIGIRSSYNSNSYSAVLASAILDSLSAGILLYNAYVSLMSMEISHSASFHNTSTTRKVCSFISMYIGAGLMSLIGKWA